MSHYIGFLRGINVGGKNKMKMSDLKLMMESLGFKGVTTYIQSGNVFFESEESEEIVRKKMKDEIETIFGFSSPVILRNTTELCEIIKNCPFTKDEITEAEKTNSEGESLYVSLLTKSPSEDELKYLDGFNSLEDEYRIQNRTIYLLLRHSIRNSKLANHIQKLDADTTTRNWKTMNKLHELGRSL